MFHSVIAFAATQPFFVTLAAQPPEDYRMSLGRARLLFTQLYVLSMMYVPIRGLGLAISATSGRRIKRNKMSEWHSFLFASPRIPVQARFG
jgi:hypothetical protein